MKVKSMSVWLIASFLIVWLLFSIYLVTICYQHLYGYPQEQLLLISVGFILLFITCTTLIQYCFFAESTYLYYVVYLLVNVLYFIITMSFQRPKIDFPLDWFNEIRYYVPITSLILSYLFYSAFAMKFLQVKNKDNLSYKWLKRSLYYFLALSIISLASTIFGPQSTMTKIRGALLVACMPVGLGSIVMVFIRIKNIMSKILAIGSFFFFAGSVMGFLFSSNQLPLPSESFPLNKWIFYTELGTILEVLMFSSSFSYRNKLMADEERLATQKLLNIRDEIARDLHDDIGASLSNINILSELARRNAGDTSKVNSYLEKAGEDIQHVSESINDIVWNINPIYDSFENLTKRVNRYTAEMLENSNISFEMVTPDAVTNFALDMRQRRNLFLIIKEAINNIVKYADASKVKVQLDVKKSVCELIVSDNGKGFNVSEANNGNGLRNMRQRALESGGTFTLNSSKGKGTIIEVKIPFTTQKDSF